MRLVRATPRPAISPGAVAGRPAGLALAVYEGRVERRMVSSVDLEGIERREDFALVFEGLLTVPETGVYRLTLSSDDGSRLWIGKELVVDDDGVHGMRAVTGAIALEAGTHPLRVEFFQGVGGVGLESRIEGLGLEPGPIGGALVTH